MANLSSSKKMVRKIATRTARNKSHVTNMRTYIKKIEEAIASGNAEEAKSALKEAQPKIMSVAILSPLSTLVAAFNKPYVLSFIF